MSRWSRVARFRVLASAVMSAGLLMVAAACGGDTPSEDDPAAAIKSIVRDFKVCSMVDPEPLLTTVKATYKTGPDDVSMGTGVDPGGPQCIAQLTMPKVRHAAGDQQRDTPFGQFNISVVPHDSVDLAVEDFGRRMTQDEGRAPTDLKRVEFPGSWAQGEVLTGSGNVDNLTVVLVRQDSYLVKIEVRTPVDTAFYEKFPFSVDDVATTAKTMEEALYTAVTTEVTAG